MFGLLINLDRELPVTEISLSGGNVSSGVVRIGDTVRRPAGPWTPAVHALLGYMHAAGFDGAPRPLGLDEQGREVLAFIPGTTAWPDNFGLLDPDDRLRRVARLIRDFHDAVTGFCPPPDARWQVLIPAEGTGIIAHHDLAPWNLVISRRRWAFIDWDTAAPGSVLWDVAYALHGDPDATEIAGVGLPETWSTVTGNLTVRPVSWVTWTTPPRAALANVGAVAGGVVVTVTGVFATSVPVEASSVSGVFAGLMFMASIDVVTVPVSEVIPWPIAALTALAGRVALIP
jgi:Phosphotransferase enzyme family